MTTRLLPENVCLICREQAVDIEEQEHSVLIQCLTCGTYEILKLAAIRIQQYGQEERFRFLDEAKRVAELQGGPPLLREPFLRNRFEPVPD